MLTADGRDMTNERRNERLVALVIAASLALNYPIAFLFSEQGLLFGIPVLYTYLYLTWAIFIALVAAVMERPMMGTPPVDELSSKQPDDA